MSLPGKNTAPKPPNLFDKNAAEKLSARTGTNITPEEMQSERRQRNRDKQAEFKARMQAQNYSRTHIWISPDSRRRLHKLATNTSKEMVIEEALELLEIVRNIWPDSDMSDIQPGKIKRILSAVPRNPKDGTPDEHADDPEREDGTMRRYAVEMKNRRLAAVRETLRLTTNRNGDVGQ